MKNTKEIGNSSMFQLLYKTETEEVKALELSTGCLIQIVTRNKDNLATNLIFMPDVKIKDDVDNGKKLIG